jgi:D-alanyl-lipoteichoic acid acyltransferase DltB (MBOAT superfamily)
LIAGNRLKTQNMLLLAASYFFYGCWDYRFLSLLLFSTALDYFTGLKIGHASTISAKRTWLLLSVTINLGLLGFFKYYNFFIENFTALLHHMGYHGDTRTLNIILPIGISFYTFHGLSYVFDIYRDKIKPTYNFIDYAVFVGFFPLLIAGPIERATHLLPQVQQPRHFDRAIATDGLRQILWGLFKKMVIADGSAQFVDMVFKTPSSYHGSELAICAVLFAFQIYADFSGYSDIAIGVGRLLGFDLLRNFHYPFFSTNMTEFWRRWHISLSTWFRDYLFTPLAVHFRNWGKASVVFALFVTFTICGLWHGASWTCIIFGILHGFALIFEFLTKKGRKKIAQRLPPVIYTGISLLLTFSYACFAFIFFRAESTTQARLYIGRLFSPSLFQRPNVFPIIMITLITLFMVVEWMGKDHEYGIARIGLKWPKLLRWAFYYCLIIVIFSVAPKTQQFIYFQF